MNSWREGRDDNGCNMSKQAYDSFQKYSRRSGQDYVQEFFSGGNYIDPSYVTYMPQLHEHLCSLLDLFDSYDMYIFLIWGSYFMEVRYIFGGTSGYVLVSSWIKPSSKTLIYRCGIWGV